MIIIGSFTFPDEKESIVSLLSPIDNKWRQIGQALNIGYRDLENISDEKYCDAQRLSIVLQIWFDQKTSDITWNTIINAIELPPVNEPSLAESIKLQLIHIFP